MLNLEAANKELFILYKGLCGVCHRNRATTLHELTPRSRAGKLWYRSENRIPICTRCHSQEHVKGSVTSRASFVRSHANRYLEGIGANPASEFERIDSLIKEK
jgi:5-methylcytosine-specific restriction endonuclease McrA